MSTSIVTSQPCRFAVARAATAVVAATGVAQFVWVATHVVGGVQLTVGSGAGSRPVGAVDVSAAALVGGLAACCLLAILERRAGGSQRSQARRTWCQVAVVATALSLLGPLTLAATATATLALIAMHVAVAAVLIFLLGLRSDSDLTT